MDDEIPPPPVPPAPDPLEMEPTIIDVGRRSRGRLVWGAAFVAIVALIGGIVVLAGQDDDIDADEALTQAQEAVDGAESYRYDLKQTSRMTVGNPDGAGSETTTRSVTRGEIGDEQHWSVVAEASMDPYFDEEITPWEARRVGDQLYSSGGLPASEQVGPAWSQSEAFDLAAADEAASYAEMLGYMFEDTERGELDPSSLIQFSLSGYLPDITMDPANIERVVRDATDPEVEESLADGGVRLRATLPPVAAIAKAAEEHDIPLPPVDVVIDLAEDRLPTAVRFAVAVDGASETVEAIFRDWGAPIVVEAPADAEIDHTPWIEEELIGQVDPSAVRRPTSVPSGMELVSAYTYEGYDSEGEEVDPSCRELNLGYGSKAEADRLAELGDDVDYEDPDLEAFLEQQPQLSLTLAPARCEGDLPEDEDPFDEEFGEFVARGVEDAEEYGYFEVKVDDLIIDLSSSNLTDEQLLALLRSLERTTVEELAASIPAWAKDETYSGPMYGFGGGPGGYSRVMGAIG